MNMSYPPFYPVTTKSPNANAIAIAAAAMHIIKVIATVLGAVAALAVAAPPLFAQPAPIAPALQAAVAGPHRESANRLRDRYRHPLETLAFFGIREDMTVIEISPGAGWYSEILGPLLYDKGRLILAGGATAGRWPDILVRAVGQSRWQHAILGCYAA